MKRPGISDGAFWWGVALLWITAATVALAVLVLTARGARASIPSGGRSAGWEVRKVKRHAALLLLATWAGCAPAPEPSAPPPDAQPSAYASTALGRVHAPAAEEPTAAPTPEPAPDVRPAPPDVAPAPADAQPACGPPGWGTPCDPAREWAGSRSCGPHYTVVGMNVLAPCFLVPEAPALGCINNGGKGNSGWYVNRCEDCAACGRTPEVRQ